jgi:hypothetical protein
MLLSHAKPTCECESVSFYGSYLPGRCCSCSATEPAAAAAGRLTMLERFGTVALHVSATTRDLFSEAQHAACMLAVVQHTR